MSIKQVVAGAAAAGVVAVAALVAGPATATTQAGAATPRCTNADLVASYRATDSGASHRFGRIVLTNVSHHACVTGGYGGLSYVGDGNGTQIGAAAVRTPSRVRLLVVRPGKKVVSEVSAAVASVYPHRKCRPAHVDGFRVYVPNATRSQFVKHPTTGCRNPRIHLLAHKAYRRP